MDTGLDERVGRQSTATSLTGAANGAVRTLIGAPCLGCGAVLDRPLDGPVCAHCWRGISRLTPPFCAHCGEPLASSSPPGDPRCGRCRDRPPAFTSARSAGVYDGTLRAVLHAFKYERRRALARQLAALARTAGDDVLRNADAVVPVPLHPLRAWQRGFNQSDDLAQELGLPVWRVLRRRRHGPPQVGLPASQRHANVAGAYALTASARLLPWVRRRLRGAVVVVVDDVMTTGATIEACATVLRSASVRDVRALTVARAVSVPPRPPAGPLRPSAARR